MPNHVTNKISASGPADVVAKLKAMLLRPVDPEKDEPTESGLVVDFNLFFPMPESLGIGDSPQTVTLLTLPKNSLLKEHEDRFDKHFFWPTLLKSCVEFKDKAGNGIDWDSLTVQAIIDLLEQYPDFAKTCNLNIELGRACIQNLQRYGYTNWYWWRMANWGTKWNAYHQYVDVSDTELYITFDTAWSLPEPIYREIAKLFPELKMEVLYIDEGCFFAGTYVLSGGCLNDHQCSDDEFKQFAETHFGWSFEEEE
ncbi:hypothetical protein [Neisseria arctica]|uniref:DUF1281 family ferredoxin-like fold protein n=1 Tax=Neisseria arctica TaxID=1470200 RepID=UPI00069A9D99|nr:hypothetical protein [Neisseria arctica]UOO85693.1 hypothetical protein LVJ86_05485 [Neisseria arctica]